MAVALSFGAILLGVAADRLRRRGVGPEALLGLVAAVFIATQFALILRLPLPSYLQWAVVAAVGAATVLSFAILAEYFPKELAGRANGALNLFHIAAAFVVQYATGVVLQQKPLLSISSSRSWHGSGLRCRGLSSDLRRHAARVRPNHSPPPPASDLAPVGGNTSIRISASPTILLRSTPQSTGIKAEVISRRKELWRMHAVIG
jgi:MFS family permease